MTLAEVRSLVDSSRGHARNSLVYLKLALSRPKTPLALVLLY
jgi:hypothetical protein